MFNPKIFWLEIPFFVIVSVFFFFPSVKNVFIRNFLPLIPALLLYGLFDTFYGFFGRAATPSDFANILDIFRFSIPLAIGLFFAYSLIPLSIGLSIYVNKYTFFQLKHSLLIRLCFFLIFVIFLTSPLVDSFQKKYFHYTVWAQEDTVRENGRFNSSVFYAKQEHSNAKILEAYSTNKNKAINIKKTLYPGDILEKRNVHIIVLESFIDPRLIKELNLDDSFIAKELLTFFGENGRFSRVISPIYGGGTAESEFELLTGIKGLGKVNQIEFNVMQGEQTDSFVNILGLYGYYLHATIAPSSEFFNSKRAYKSLGFDQVQYLSDQNLSSQNLSSPNSSIKPEDNSPIFDGDLFDYNLSFLKEYFASNTHREKPLFNYVLGMYGHLPFKRDVVKRPNVTDNLHSDDRLNRIADQFYYRTKAIADYLKSLTKLDPNSIIFITSDHLPSILSKRIHYQFDNKVNIALMLNAGNFKNVDGKMLYQIPWSIWDSLTSRSARRVVDEKVMSELYYTLLSQSLSKDD